MSQGTPHLSQEGSPELKPRKLVQQPISIQGAQSSNQKKNSCMYWEVEEAIKPEDSKNQTNQNQFEGNRPQMKLQQRVPTPPRQLYKDFQQVSTPPILSKEGSPELKPYIVQYGYLERLIQESNQQQNVLNQSNNKSKNKNPFEWEDDKEDADIQKFLLQEQATDPETLALIQKLQDEDRDAQVKMKKELKVQEDSECQICCDFLMESNIYPLEGCDHVYHVDCIKGYLEQAMKERRVEIKCPDAECKYTINEFEIEIISGKDKRVEYNNYTLDQFVDNHGADMSWCPTPDCKYAFVLGDEEELKDFECLLCKKRYCLNCRVLFHKDQTCKEYQVANTRDANDIKFEKFVKGKKFKVCTKCKFWVEKNQGCNHMTCRCGYQFCYVCGGKYMECECVKAALEKQKQHQAKILEQRQAQKEAKAARGRGRGKRGVKK